ncbi:MAG: radical SAM protein [Candidatus Methanomethylicia archaeon]
MVDFIRVSIGTASKLNLLRIKVLAEPTTAYLMSFSDGKCTANCAFCTQARDSKSSVEYLSRIVWPKFNFNDVLKAFKNSNRFKRICIQTLVYPRYIEETIEIVSKLKSITTIPISVSIHPRSRGDIEALKNAGVERIGIGVDASSKQVFASTKRPFSWDKTMNIVFEARDVFGPNKVSVHLIYGLGDSDREFLELIHKLYSLNINVGLFTFTPVEGTLMESHNKPNYSSYRGIQLAHYLIKIGLATINDFNFNHDGKLIGISINKDKLVEIVESGEPFKTSGCPNCNRPFYNESPGEILYNYPTSEMVLKDMEKIRVQLKHLLN